MVDVIKPSDGRHGQPLSMCMACQKYDKSLKMCLLPKCAKAVEYFIRVRCKCGQELILPKKTGWELRIIGLLQFRCPCKRVITIPEVLWK